MGNLNEYLKKYVSELIAESPRTISVEEQERHKIYSLLLMSMVSYFYNGNKSKIDESVKIDTNKDYGNNLILGNNEKRGKFLKNQYLGHNIACFGVDRDGFIIDFDFNHNEIFNSSVQHAEARLLNRMFSLNQINDSWNIGKEIESSAGYSKLLEGVTVYTSLESCSQCSGIMTLGNVKEVVYLQDDPGQDKIGNILFRLTESKDLLKKGTAPRPIPAKAFNLDYLEKLSKAFDLYKEKTKNQSITSFLCTQSSFDIFLEAEEEFSKLDKASLKFPLWKGTYLDSEGKEQKTELDNEAVLNECIQFYKYAALKARRGTPHI
ncbi:MAG: hypothetical protein V4622_09675 [Bacteroidota bacterium]